MKLLTDELRARLPPLYSQEAEPEPMVYAKFFLPGTGWTWYVLEGGQEDDEFRFFGFVVGLDSEFGYFLLSELEGVRSPLASKWNAMFRSAKAGSPMLYPRPIHNGAPSETKNLLGLFFERLISAAHVFGVKTGRGPASRMERKHCFMKKLSVVVAGTGQIRDVEIQPGTTAGDILHQLNLSDYLLSKGPNEPFFAAAESVYDKVNDGEKVFASTKAEVGITVCAA